MAAASVLAGVAKLWERVLPELEDQEWRGEGRESNYSGVFRLVEARRLGMHLHRSGSDSGGLAAGWKCWWMISSLLGDFSPTVEHSFKTATNNGIT